MSSWTRRAFVAGNVGGTFEGGRFQHLEVTASHMNTDRLKRNHLASLKLTATAPENGWFLKTLSFSFGFRFCFQVRWLLVSGRVSDLIENEQTCFSVNLENV